MGIQKSKQSKNGLIVRVDRISPFPDRFHSHHLLVQCFVEGLYEVVTDPVEEPDTGGLHNSTVREIDSKVGLEDPLTKNLVTEARDAFDRRIKQLASNEVTLVFEDVYTGTMRALSDDPIELSFFLIEAIEFPEDPDDNIMFEPDVRKRLRFCIDAMNSGAQFRRVASRRSLSRSRESLDFSRNLLFASGLMIFFGIALGGMDALLPFRRS